VSDAFERLGGWSDGEARAALAAFRAFWRDDPAPLREAVAPSPALREAGAAAQRARPDEARSFFAAHFEPRFVGRGLLTGYYEPQVDGALDTSDAFPAPLLARPSDPTARSRAEIEAAPGAAVVWLRDAVEAYFVQVQGSARVRLPDGTTRRLVYDGRNGRPYSSLGRLLIEAGEIAEAEMTAARLKAWLRADPERGRAWMRRNESYVFFRLGDGEEGPMGGAGRALTPLRSLAVDRELWSYGLPFWVAGALPWRSDAAEPFARALIAEDTGSAITGAARGDLYFGGGEAAFARAGALRHEADFFVLRPRAA